MEWGTVLASAGVSAVVGAVVSLLAVSQVTVRQARAAEREDARRSIRELAETQVRLVMRYSFVEREGSRAMRDSDDGTSHLDDHTTVAAILIAARGLSKMRRRLVERRCRRIFGRYWVDLALYYPSASANGEESFLVWLTANTGIVPTKNDSWESLIHRAYSKPPGAPEQRELGHELRRLAASR